MHTICRAVASYILSRPSESDDSVEPIDAAYRLRSKVLEAGFRLGVGKRRLGSSWGFPRKSRHPFVRHMLPQTTPGCDTQATNADVCCCRTVWTLWARDATGSHCGTPDGDTSPTSTCGATTQYARYRPCDGDGLHFVSALPVSTRVDSLLINTLNHDHCERSLHRARDVRATPLKERGASAPHSSLVHRPSQECAGYDDP